MFIFQGVNLVAVPAALLLNAEEKALFAKVATDYSRVRSCHWSYVIFSVIPVLILKQF